MIVVEVRVLLKHVFDSDNIFILYILVRSSRLKEIDYTMRRKLTHAKLHTKFLQLRKCYSKKRSKESNVQLYKVKIYIGFISMHVSTLHYGHVIINLYLNFYKICLEKKTPMQFSNNKNKQN